MNYKNILPEKLKKILRNMWRAFYRKWIKLKYFRKLGFVNASKCIVSLAVRRQKFGVFVPLLQQHVFIRPRTSDVATFEKIFILEEYALSCVESAQFIIDAGANVGYAALFFAHKYPEASIVCIEPEISNVEILRQNIRQHKKIKVLPNALWHTTACLQIDNPSDEKYAFRVSQVPQSNIQSITVPDILRSLQWPKIDICKIDIEGAEKQVFSENTDWIQHTRAIVIELHEQMVPGCKQSFYCALKKYGPYQHFMQGENTIVLRNQHVELP
ncbi:FkbM family methyltransferase [Candidatus Uabimicrobium amorphum]|uniref:Methyltransferase FkbM domain-containing protein n=1 Tax=Uabimicrobium amorphum TaxID=2596890 RepID=A0A5S9F3U6_UABAM|nr:FkbM family methyltransferase [Candidatus Uabimicrobium amorphum]BBM84878.1 hypothetical protein UABAM_03239 [Candidatus Uabimicrobium amorphum]